MPKNKGQIITTTVTDHASRGFDDKWKLTQDVSFSKFETQVYWEHGLSKKITLLASTSYQDVDFVSRAGEENVTGFGTTTIGGRYLIYQKGKTVGSLQGNLLFAGQGEVISDADLGRGGNGLEIRSLIGHSFQILKKDAFLDLQSAWIYRGEDSPQTVKIDATAGLKITKKREFIAQLFYAQTGAHIIENDRILPNRFIKAQASLIHKRSAKTSTQFGVFQTLTGQNIVQERGVFVAVWRRY